MAQQSSTNTGSRNVASKVKKKSTRKKTSSVTPAPSPLAGATMGAPASPTSSRGLWILSISAIAISLLSLLAVAAVGYQFFIIGQMQRQGIETQLVFLQNELSQQQEKQAQELQQQQQSNAAIRQQMQKLPTMQDALQQLSASVEKVYLQLDRNLASWALEEVEQLVLLANYRLALNADTGAAIVALKLADQRLLETGDPGAIASREQLAKDILQLQAIEPLDITGLALQLGELIRQAEHFPLLEAAFGLASAADSATTESTTEGTNWKRNLDEVWQDVQALVRIQNIDEPAAPLMAPEQRFYLRENLKLNLASARLALLQKDQENFKQSVAAATEILNHYFDPASAAVQSGRQGLETLAQVVLSPELPDISQSLLVIQELKKKRN